MRMCGPWLPLALLAVATLVLGPFPVDRGVVVAMREGDRAAAERRYSEALHAYGVAARRCPGCPQPHLRQGEVFTAQGRYAEAWAVYLAAVRLGGLDDAAMGGLAHLHLAQGSEARAIGYLQRLLARRPGRSELWAQLGEAYLAAGEQAKAGEAYERALDMDVTDAQRQVLHDRLGMMCVEQDVQCALDHFSEVERGPDLDLAGGARRLVDALRLIAQDGKAIDPALARAKLGEALFRHGDLALARRQFEMALELEPAYVDAHAYLGHVLSLLGQGEAAVEHLQRASALEPGYPLPTYFLGMHYARRGWWITAREVLLRAHDQDPSNPAICAAVADTYLRGADPWYAVAEQWLHAAVDNAPDDARFHLLLAHLYVDRAVDPGVRGVAVAQVAVDLAPENSEAHETLGWAYHLGGKPDRALEPLRRALELAPDEPRIYYRLGEVYRALGRSELARQHLQAAIDLDWNGPIGERARQSMAK